jgi:hypothetical protein
MPIVHAPSSHQPPAPAPQSGQGIFRKILRWTVPPLCLIALFSYIAAGNLETTTSSSLNFPYQLLAIFIPTLAAALAATWFASSFTGNPVGYRNDQFQFAYFFVVISFAVLTVPPLVGNVAFGGEPLGIISGCVPEANVADLQCTRLSGATGQNGIADALPANAQAEANPDPIRNQWLVNIGGTLTAQPGGCQRTTRDCALGSPSNRAYVSGGVVVPLPLVIIAMFGGAISLSRRIPEIQKQSEDGYVGTAAKPVLEKHEAREQLVFQIMQFVSAPLTAIAAHQIIEPETVTGAVALAFLAGFGSETILMMIRGMTDGLTPKPLQAKGIAPEKTESAEQLPPKLAADTASMDAQAHVTQHASTHSQVNIRLAVESEKLDPHTLTLTLNGQSVDVSEHGLVDLNVESARKHVIVARALRQGQPVSGTLELTPDADDENRSIALQLA